MIVLKNIKKTSKTIEADYYCEGCGEKGYVKISLETEDYIEIRFAPGRENSSAPAHALYELLRLAKLDVMPEEKTVIWY